MLLGQAEFDIRKEVAWAISNATSGGTPDQIKFLVQQNCIRPLCDLLDVADIKIITVALEGLENILKVGEQDAKNHAGVNQHANFVQEAGGLDKIDLLQRHENMEIYDKAIKILEMYFEIEDEEESEITANAEGQFSFGGNTGGGFGSGNFSLN